MRSLEGRDAGGGRERRALTISAIERSSQILLVKLEALGTGLTRYS